MKCMFSILMSATWLACLLVLGADHPLPAQGISSLADDGQISSTREGEWLWTRMSKYSLGQRQVNLTPQAEPKPALSVVLIPNDFDLIDGNAAVQYLQAIGYAEQSAAQQAMQVFNRKSRQEMEAAGKDSSQAEPDVWLQTAPADLPLERVKEYLNYSSFQTRYLEQAVQRRHCDFDRNIREVDNPIGYLLPEVQALRDLARLQSMRFRLAIVENRPRDALRIFGQQLALGHHLDDEEFLVSNLVGIACAGIGIQDSLYLSEQAEAPNMYWAIAALPQPLVSMEKALAYERQFLFEQFKQLRDIDETPQPPIYWKRLLESLAVDIAQWGEMRLPGGAYTAAGFTALVATAYPGAKLFLVEELKMEADLVEALPVPQVVVLAMRRIHEQLRDEVFKMQYVPLAQRDGFASEKAMQRVFNKYGGVGALSGMFLPAIQAALGAKDRLQQQLALLQTIEAIRDHLASHAGQLPEELSELRLPAPLDPQTSQPFEYHREAGRAKLSGAVASHVKYEFELVPTIK